MFTPAIRAKNFLHAPQGLKGVCRRPYLIASFKVGPPNGKKSGWRAQGRRLPDSSRFLE
jgi:hypothetical protein